MARLLTLLVFTAVEAESLASIEFGFIGVLTLRARTKHSLETLVVGEDLRLGNFFANVCYVSILEEGKVSTLNLHSTHALLHSNLCEGTSC